MQKEPPSLRLLAISWAVIYVTLVAGWYQAPDGIWGAYSLIDGRWAAWNAEFTFRWGRILDLSPFNFFSGMGSMFLPNLPWLNPGAWPLGLPLSALHRYTLSMSIYLVEISASIVFLGRTLGLSWTASHLAAQLHALFLFPPLSGYFLAFPWYSLAPVNGHLAAIANTLVALTLRLGTRSRRHALVTGAAILALCVIGVLSGPLTLLTYLPLYAAVTVALVSSKSATWRQRRWASAVWLLTIAVLAIAFLDYYRGTVQTSARYLASPPASLDLASLFGWTTWNRMAAHGLCEAPQALLCTKYPIYVFTVIGLLGAAWWTAFGQAAQRVLGITVIVFVLALHGYYFLSFTEILGRLQVFSVPYLAWSSYSMLAVLAAVALSIPVTLAQRIGPGRHARVGAWMRRAVVLSVSCAALFIAVHGLGLNVLPSSRRFWRPIQRPAAETPVVTPIVRHLVEHAALSPGAPFRGYTASFFAAPTGWVPRSLGYTVPPVPVQLYIDARDLLQAKFKNRLAETDLWTFAIPTLEEYGQWVSRQAYTFMRELLAQPGDALNPSFLRVHKLDVPLLEALGVRYLITDADVGHADARLVLSDVAATGETVHLYELARPNLASYSPTTTVGAATFREAIALLQQHHAGLASTVVLSEPLRAPLVAATRAVIRADIDGFRIDAESRGRSLVVLPVQFSHCLSLRGGGRQSDGHPRLLRVNLIQTGVEFEGRLDAVVRLSFGAFTSGGCRRVDAADLDALGVW